MMAKRRLTKPRVEKSLRDIRRATRRKYSSEEKIRIVMEGLRAEESIAWLCREEGINTKVHYRCSKVYKLSGTLYNRNCFNRL